LIIKYSAACWSNADELIEVRTSSAAVHESGCGPCAASRVDPVMSALEGIVLQKSPSGL
jgi:hypothetical protein